MEEELTVSTPCTKCFLSKEAKKLKLLPPDLIGDFRVTKNPESSEQRALGG